MLKILIKIFKRYGPLKAALILAIFLLIALPLFYCFLVYTALYAELRPSKNSQNIAATNKFIDGYFFIHIADSLRWAFNYDSVVLRPLFVVADKKFNEAAALLPKDSVEDVMWWAIYHKHIYALAGNRTDKSLVNKLTDADFKRVLGYIRRLPYGKIYNDAPLLRDWRLPNMLGLVSFYSSVNAKRKIDFVLNHADEAAELSHHLQVTFEKYYQNSPNKLLYFEMYNSQQIRILIAPILKFYSDNNHALYADDPEDIKLDSKTCEQMAGVDIEKYFRAAIAMSREKKVFFRKIYRQDSHYLNELYAYCPQRRTERLQILKIIAYELQEQYEKGELK